MTPENPRGGTLLGHPPGDTCTKKKQILGRAGCFWGVFLGGVTLGCHLGGVTLGVSPDDDRQNQSRSGNQVDERSQINAKRTPCGSVYAVLKVRTMSMKNTKSAEDDSSDHGRTTRCYTALLMQRKNLVILR